MLLMHSTLAEIATAEHHRVLVGRTVLSAGHRRGDLGRPAAGKAAGQGTTEAVSGRLAETAGGVFDPN